MNYRSRLAACLWALLLLASSPAYGDKPVIIWAKTNFPPFSIQDGPLRDQGIYDTMMPPLFALLPEFEHRVVDMTIARTLEMMKHEDNICNAGLVRTAERDKTIVFSRETTRVFRNTLIVRRKDEGVFQPFMGNGEIDLDALLHDTPVRLCTVRGRRYGTEIDTVLADHAGTSDVRAITHSSSAVRMLAEGHTDAVIAFPQEALYAVRVEASSMPQDILMSLPIKNAGVISGHIGCSKGKLGERVIRAIDAAQRIEKVRALYKRSVAAWNDQYLRP